MRNFSDFIVYVDESGDHGLNRVDSDFPVFALVFVVVRKTDYIEKIVPYMQRIKFDFWGHDWIVFHEHEIRKQKGDFSIFKNDINLREQFYKSINEFIEEAPFRIITAVIRKDLLKNKYQNPFNPYDLALGFCLERLIRLMLIEGQAGKKITLIFEKRGRLEDKALEEEFYKITGKAGYQNSQSLFLNGNKLFKNMDFEILFAGKERNFIGMQLADLIARPIARNVLKPEQENRAYSLIRTKYPDGIYNKIFP